MNCDVIGFIALDEILGFFFAGVVDVAFELHLENDFLHDSAANWACFRVPLDVIATFEDRGYLSVATERKMLPAKQWSGEKRCQRYPQHHGEYRVPASAFDQPPALWTARRY